MAARKKSPSKKAPKKKTARNLTRELSTLLGKRLLPDLKERAKESPVAAALAVEFEAERQRTADSFEIWVSHKLEQVAVAWILSCVFVRTLEDRGYLTHRRLAGEGAQDAEHLFFDLFPSLTSRDYLLAVFRELSHLPGAEDVLGPKRNLAWRLAPSSEVVRELLGVFRETDAAGQLVWGFGGSDTRFLGDLYQDISDGVRERFALLQTPEFIEEFILDLTLDPAIAEFGLETVRLLDPTCGSGHFLLGAFRRLFEARQRHSPGLPVKEHATEALAQVAGADINPYAVAIARFRLVLAYLEAAQIQKLRDAPRLSPNVVAVDSLLVGANQRTLPLAAHSENAAAWGESHWQLEDRDEALRVFRRQYYHAIVGNPPYRRCEDAKLKDEYRQLYRSCYREFSLVAPFTERFFQLAIDGGFVGMINANSFIKREFGKKLVEVLAEFDLTHVIDTSGVRLPDEHGAGTTVILAGRHQPPTLSYVRLVSCLRQEPDKPLVFRDGLVWSSIRKNLGTPGFENEFISISNTPRETLRRHPWNFSGGRASALKQLLETRASARLRDVVTEIGFGAVTREDDLYLLGDGALERAKIPLSQRRPLVAGENVRDWSIADVATALWPYDPTSLSAIDDVDDSPVCQLLWPYKTQLSRRVAYGNSQLERGLRWFEYSMFFANRFRSPLAITFAFVVSHNHFALDRGGKAFKQSAPIIKLPPTATEDDYLALLGYLNSSTACFWMKQECFNKGSSESLLVKKENGVIALTIDRGATGGGGNYEFSGTALLRCPLPSLDGLAPLAREALLLGQQCSGVPELPSLNLSELDLQRNFEDWSEGRRRALERLVALQEEIDWVVYSKFDLLRASPRSAGRTPTQMHPGERPFEGALARKYTQDELPVVGNDGHVHTLKPRDCWSAEELAVWEARLTPPDNVATIEQFAFKRRFRPRALREDFSEAVRQRALAEIEACMRAGGRIRSLRDIVNSLGDVVAPRIYEFLSENSDAPGQQLAIMRSEAIPCLSILRFTESGLAKRAMWEKAWDLQRREDAGEKHDIPVPPKYDSKDYRDPIYWRLRGKLDVPKECFISYPGAEKDDDPSPLYGWAGWDHLQRATTLAGLYHERKTEEAWPPERLMPLLAGLLELIPWLKQWHNAPSDDLGGEGAGDWYDGYVAAEARSLGKTLDDLRAWRPASKTARNRTGTR